MKYFIILFVFLSAECNSKEMRDMVVILDSGISQEQSKQPYMCERGIVTVFKDNGLDEHKHGTNIISLISPNINVKTTCIVSIKVWRPNLENTVNAFITGLKYAVTLKPKFINISMSGSYGNEEEKFMYIRLLKAGSVISVASGNEHQNLTNNCFAFPACYKKQLPMTLKHNFNVVGSNTTGSNYGEPVGINIDGAYKGTPVMSGSSQATAIFTAALVGGDE